MAPLLDVNNLSVSFRSRRGDVQAVKGLDFSVDAGSITALIGESGSGKSVACYSLLGLVPTPPGSIDSGSAHFDGRDLLRMQEQELRRIRGRDIALVFQDPMTCLNPFMTIGQQLTEPLRYHQGVDRATARSRGLQLMDEVGIRDPELGYAAFPHQFSGGMRQRVMIAMALINEPRLLIADEPTTALDVTIQAQILELLAQLQKKRDIGIVFISHDLAVVSDIADQIVVMCEGEAVESADRTSIFHSPAHPYTQKLLAAIPSGAKAPAPERTTQPLLTVSNLSVEFNRDGGQRLKAVDDVSLALQRGATLGLVGESGSGKSTIARAILRLVPTVAGRIEFDGTELTGLDRRAMKAMRRRMQIIFQDPFASLNPRMTVFDTLAEPFLLHGLATKNDVEAKVHTLMDDVGLARTFTRKYPHEFSGGQRQRIAIGRALATKPELIVADEPVSALDVTIQAQILRLLEDLAREYQLTTLFISHDLAVVRQLADDVVVLRGGMVIESGPAGKVLAAPQETYTQELLAAVPGDAWA
ncbi:MAG: ABC transporter ATP-binding protein [Halioglobus sp.]|nr:ABC transporter ATP-binding protein [Halioglobus sp.]